MMPQVREAATFAASSLIGASCVLADSTALPLESFFESEDNDSFEMATEIDASDLVSDGFDDNCFFIVGKLQEDCVYDCQPKCGLIAYGKPKSVYEPGLGNQAVLVPGAFYEPILQKSLNGVLDDVPVNPVDRTVRLGVGATTDVADMTINGLASNGLHGQLGEITVKVFFNTVGGETRGVDPDRVFTFPLVFGAEAFRLALKLTGDDSDVTSVDVVCCEDTGRVGVCWDVDYFEVSGLDEDIPRTYCITVIGGLDEECLPTDLSIGEFNKDGLLLNWTPENTQESPYPELCTMADDTGTLRFAISGPLDTPLNSGGTSFNGLANDREAFADAVELALFFEFGALVDYIGGASTKDGEVNEVVRLTREQFDFLAEPPAALSSFTFFQLACGAPVESFLEHGSCGGYCVKIRRGEHVDSGPPDDDGQERTTQEMNLAADIDVSGAVDAADLAYLLSFWGPVELDP